MPFQFKTASIKPQMNLKLLLHSDIASDATFSYFDRHTLSRARTFQFRESARQI